MQCLLPQIIGLKLRLVEQKRSQATIYSKSNDKDNGDKNLIIDHLSKQKQSTRSLKWTRKSGNLVIIFKIMLKMVEISLKVFKLSCIVV